MARNVTDELAFPMYCGTGDDINNSAGMALRDYFAAAALTGMLSNPRGDLNGVVIAAYRIADAMIDVRERSAP